MHWKLLILNITIQSIGFPLKRKMSLFLKLWDKLILKFITKVELWCQESSLRLQDSDIISFKQKGIEKILKSLWGNAIGLQYILLIWSKLSFELILIPPPYFTRIRVPTKKTIKKIGQALKAIKFWATALKNQF